MAVTEELNHGHRIYAIHLKALTLPIVFWQIITFTGWQSHPVAYRTKDFISVQNLNLHYTGCSKVVSGNIKCRSWVQHHFHVVCRCKYHAQYCVMRYRIHTTVIYLTDTCMLIRASPNISPSSCSIRELCDAFLSKHISVSDSSLSKQRPVRSHTRQICCASGLPYVGAETRLREHPDALQKRRRKMLYHIACSANTEGSRVCQHNLWVSSLSEN